MPLSILKSFCKICLTQMVKGNLALSADAMTQMKAYLVQCHHRWLLNWCTYSSIMLISVLFAENMSSLVRHMFTPGRMNPTRAVFTNFIGTKIVQKK